MASFYYINMNVQGDNQLMIPDGTRRWDNINIYPPVMRQEEDSSARKRRRQPMRRDEFLLARLHLLPPRAPKQPPPSPAAPFRILNPTMTRFLFKKQLNRSDVEGATRILLPKFQVENHLPRLDFKEGIWMHIDDLDYYQVWTLKFRFWNNPNSGKIYVFENTKDFVTSHGLEVGDSIEVYKDIMSGTFIIKASKISDSPGLIDQRYLRRSKENDEKMISNQSSVCINKEEPKYVKDSSVVQVGQRSSNVNNNGEVVRNDRDHQADKIIVNEEVVQPAKPAQDCSGQLKDNSLDDILMNEDFLTNEDFDYLYTLLED